MSNTIKRLFGLNQGPETLDPDVETIHTSIVKIYKHMFNGGTMEQIDHEDMIILILNPHIKNGVFRRKRSYGTKLYEKNILYLNRVTGNLVLKSPGSWGGLDLRELEERLNDMEQHKLL